MQIAIMAPTPRQARGAVADLLADQPAEIVETARLLASEIVSNAIEHGGGAEEITLLRGATLLRVEVLDGNPTLPTILHVAPNVPRGRGMFLVDSLSSRWRTHATGTGKTVSFEVDLKL